MPTQEEENAAASSVDGSNPPSRRATPRAGRVSAIPRKRHHAGRSRATDVDASESGSPQASGGNFASPSKRRRGRPNVSGGRWSRHRGPSHITQAPTDREGNPLDIVDDEVALPQDPEGESKIDKNGQLLGGRQYRVRTFPLLGHGDRLYMLSTEPARCIGFRDSYLFFQKHKYLYKIIIEDAAKRDLISRDLIPHSYKGRAIGVVTAHSVFREFGAKIVVGGRKIIDDYYVQEARDRGDVEGELAVPEDRLPGPGETYNRNQFVAWHGASNVYHSLAPAVPANASKIVEKKRRIAVTSANWMYEHARDAR